MKALYLDTFSGISGDMFLGALIDLGVSADELEKALRQLNVSGWQLKVSRQQRNHITGTKLDVVLESEPGAAHHHPTEATSQHDDHTHSDHHHHPHTHDRPAGHRHSTDPAIPSAQPHSHAGHRTFAEITQLIQSAPYSDWVKEKAVAVFRRIAEAEGRIHDQPPERVHFHEVGAVDSIVDIVGGCLALDMLGRPTVHTATPVEGTGWIRCAHGTFPVPAPATLEILRARGVTITQCDEPHELITPTGAALLAEFAQSFGPLQDFTLEKVGYGLGTRENKTRPNLLRVLLGRQDGSAASLDWEIDQVAVIETNLDDVSAEILGHVSERFLAAGALDVFHTPIQMKKNRPGVLFTVLTAPDKVDSFAEMILRETTAFGVRISLTDRRKLQREIVTVTTDYGDIEVKVGRLNNEVIQSAPEFESCRRRALEHNVPVKTVYDAAKRAAVERKET